MPFRETKVYFDGSHYIAIPHTTRPAKKRIKPPEEVIAVKEENKTIDEFKNEKSAFLHTQDATLMSLPAEIGILESNINIANNDTVINENSGNTETPAAEIVAVKIKYITHKQLFNKFYDEYKNLSRVRRRKAIITDMVPYFKDKEDAIGYIDRQLERKLRNLIARRVRCVRKANLAELNYFVTFTYDGKRLTEGSFKKRLNGCLGHFCCRKGWRYIAVWERSPEKKRLHFHGVFHIPQGSIPGLLFEKNDYNFNTHTRQITVQNTYFNDNFGRSDFEAIDDKNRLGEALSYILKYIEKTGERIIYSKGLPQFFISDINNKDIVCRIGAEDKKLLLFDDFICWDEGCHMGNVSKATIKRMRGTN